MSAEQTRINRDEFLYLRSEIERLLDRAKYYQDWPSTREQFIERMERLCVSLKYCERSHLTPITPPEAGSR